MNYSFTIINGCVFYNVHGNTANDYGFKSPTNHKCTATSPKGVNLKITDQVIAIM